MAAVCGRALSPVQLTAVIVWVVVGFLQVLSPETSQAGLEPVGETNKVNTEQRKFEAPAASWAESQKPVLTASYKHLANRAGGHSTTQQDAKQHNTV